MEKGAGWGKNSLLYSPKDVACLCPCRHLPYLISLASGEPLALAGLWEHWHAKESDVSIESATVITAAANEFMATLHHRMPVVLVPETADRWLGGDDDVLEFAVRNGPPLRAWPVSRRVNNARNEGEDLIEPAGDVLQA